MRIRGLYLIAFSSVLLVLTFICYQLIQKKSKTQLNVSTADIKSILDESSLLLGNSTLKASIKVEEALVLSKAIGNTEYLIKSMELQSQIKNIQGDTKQSLEIYQRAFELAHKNNFPHELCKINIEIGKVFYNWGQYDTSLIYFKSNLHPLLLLLLESITVLKETLKRRWSIFNML